MKARQCEFLNLRHMTSYVGLLVEWSAARVYLQGGETFCASFCASLIAGSRRAFLCVDGVDRVRLCLFVDWDWMKCTRCERLLLEKPFYHVCGFCSSSLENYFGLRTTDVKAKTDPSVSLRWNKKFWAFSKRRVFFWLCIRFICAFFRWAELKTACILCT